MVTGDPVFALFAGNLGANKVRFTCLNCGHTFGIGEGGKELPSAEEVREFESHVIPREEMPETAMYKCDCGNRFCGRIHAYCPKCGRRMTERNEFTAEDYKEFHSSKGCLGMLLLPIVFLSSLFCMLCL